VAWTAFHLDVDEHQSQPECGSFATAAGCLATWRSACGAGSASSSSRTAPSERCGDAAICEPSLKGGLNRRARLRGLARCSSLGTMKSNVRDASEYVGPSRHGVHRRIGKGSNRPTAPQALPHYHLHTRLGGSKRPEPRRTGHALKTRPWARQANLPDFGPSAVSYRCVCVPAEERPGGPDTPRRPSSIPGGEHAQGALRPGLPHWFLMLDTLFGPKEDSS
jgi:hypothetical protein